MKLFKVTKAEIANTQGYKFATKVIIEILGIKFSYKKLYSKELQTLEQLKLMLNKPSEKTNDIPFNPYSSFSLGTFADYSKNFVLLGYNYTDIGKKFGVNIGDHIQTIAVKNILEKIYPDLNYIYFDRDNLINYNGEKAFTIMQGWFSFDNCYSFMPNNNIFPLYLGTHFTEKAQEKFIKFLEKNPDYLKDKTFGCRDLVTKEFFEKLGAKAYLSRCLTLTLPKRELKSQNDIFIVDVPQEWLKYIPETLTKNSIIKNQRGLDSGKNVGYYYNSTDIYMKKSIE